MVTGGQDARDLSRTRADRPGRHGDRLSRATPAPGQRCRDQDSGDQPRRAGKLPAALPARGVQRGRPATPEHPLRLGLRRTRWPGLHGHALRARRHAARSPDARAADARRNARLSRPIGRGPRLRPRARAGPPRCQAGQRAARRARPPLSGRLRHRQGAGRERGVDQHRHGCRHARIHGSRTGPGPRRSLVGPLRPGDHRLSTARRAGAVQRQQFGRSVAATPQRAHLRGRVPRPWRVCCCGRSPRTPTSAIRRPKASLSP